MSTHEKYMRRCLEIAQNGFGLVAPNPMVGALLLRDGQVIAEGYHRGYGLPHAEAEAIGKVEDKALLRDSTLYVSLEPCNHYGKTPPCSELIIASQIPRVVVAAQDSNYKVNGSGIQRLRDAGVDVTVGILEREAREQNKRFFSFHEKKRPYVILKWAQTADGFIDICRTASEAAARISNGQAHRLSHRWRTEEQAIMVGTNTALMDNPTLTARLWPGKNPTRIVVDEKNILPRTLNIFNADAPTIVLQSEEINDWLQCFCENRLQSVIVEGGAKLLQSFIDANMWDEARIFTAPQRFGNGVAAPLIQGKIMSEEMLGDNVLTVLIPNK